MGVAKTASDIYPDPKTCRQRHIKWHTLLFRCHPLSQAHAAIYQRPLNDPTNNSPQRKSKQRSGKMSLQVTAKVQVGRSCVGKLPTKLRPPIGNLQAGGAWVHIGEVTSMGVEDHQELPRNKTRHVGKVVDCVEAKPKAARGAWAGGLAVLPDAADGVKISRGKGGVVKRKQGGTL